MFISGRVLDVNETLFHPFNFPTGERMLNSSHFIFPGNANCGFPKPLAPRCPFDGAVPEPVELRSVNDVFPLSVTPVGTLPPNTIGVEGTFELE